MKQGNAHKSFDELDRIVSENARNKFDCVIETGKATISARPVGKGDTRRWIAIDAPATNGGRSIHMDGAVEPFAFEQMCNWGAPGLAKYSRSLIDADSPEADELLADNMNYFLHNPDEKRSRRMFRFSRENSGIGFQDANQSQERNVLRSYLSDSYLRLDDEVVLDALRPEVEKLKGLEISSLNCSPDFMHVKLTQPMLRREVKVGDVVEAGIRLKNSGIGLSYLLLNDYISRLTCLNGAVSDQVIAGIKKLHRGSKLPLGILPQYHEDPNLYGEDYIPELRKQIATVIQQCLNAEHFDKLVDRLKETTKTEALKVLDPQSDKKITIPALELVDKEFGLTSADKAKVFHHLKNDRDYTQWGFANAITRTANDHENYDTATKLEEIGGKILAFRRPQWQKYVEAEFKKAA